MSGKVQNLWRGEEKVVDRCHNRTTVLMATDPDGTEHRACTECGARSVWPNGLDKDHAKFVLLRGIIPGVNLGNTFFSPNESLDPTIMADGTEAYEVTGYADTVAEAQLKLYGKVYNS